MINKIGKILTEIPSWYLILPIIMIVGVLRFTDVRTETPISEESMKIAGIIDKIKPGSKVMIVVNYGPEGRSELEESLSTLINVLSKKEISIVFATMIPTGVETTFIAIEKGISVLKTNEGKYLYGREYINIGYIAGGSIAAAMLSGGLSSVRKKDVFDLDLKNMPVMNGLNTFEDFSGFFEFSSTKMDDVPGTVLISFLSKNKTVPKIVFCTADMVSDYIPFLKSHSIDGLAGGYENVVSVTKLLNPYSNEDKRYFICTVILLYILIVIVIGNIGNLFRGKK